MPTLDITAPTLLSVSPSHNGSNVAVGTVIVLQFNEAVTAGTGTFTISDGITQAYIGRDGQPGTRIVGASDTRSFSVADGQVHISGNTVTITLDAPLQGGLDYSVTASGGAIKDIARNAFAGLSNTSQFHFTTSVPVHLDAAVTSIDISDDTGASSSDFITAHTVQNISGNYSGTLHTGEFVEVSFNNGASWHTATAASGSWSLTGTLPVGSNTLVARVSNGSSTTSPLAQDYKVDQSAPAIASLTLSDHSLEAGETATLTLVLTEKLQAPLSAADFNAVGGHLSGLSSADGLTWNATFTSTNLAGSGNIGLATGALQDAAGNPLAAGASVDFSSAVALSTTLSNDSGYSATDFITRFASQTVRVNYGAALSGGDKIQIGIDGNYADALWDGTQWARSGVTLADSGVVQTRIVDAGGTVVKAITSKAYEVDTGAPSASLSGNRLDLLDSCDTGYSNSDNLTSESQPTLRVNMAGVTGLQAGDVIEIFDNSNDNIVLGHHVLSAAELGASGQFLAGSLDIDLVDGSISQGDAHSIKVRIGNLAQSGNGAASNALDIRVDHTAPTVLSTTPTASGAGANLAAITLHFNDDVYLNVGTGFRLANDAGTEVQEFNGEALPSHYMYDSSAHALDIVLHAGLQHSTHYTLTASSGLGDYAGNKVYDVDEVVLSFTTTATGTVVLDPTLTLQADTGTAGDNVTSNGQLNIGSLASFGRWKYSLDSGASWTWAPGGDAQLHLAANTSYAAGQIKVQQWTVDNYYSAIVSNSGAIVIDSSAPSATIDFAEVDNFFGIGASLNIGDIRLGGAVSGAIVQYTLNGGGSWSDATPDGAHAVWSANGTVAAGGYIGLRVADLAGNIADNGFAAAPGAYTVYIGDGYGGSEFSTGHDTILMARDGNDRFATSDGIFRYIDGGSDSDILRLSGSGLHLDTADWQGKLLNVETIALGSSNALTVHDINALQAIAGGSTLRIDGDSGSTLDIGSGLWTLGADAAGYNTLTSGGMTLLVKSGINLLGSTVSAVATPALVFTDSSPMSGGYGTDRITADTSFAIAPLVSGGHWKYSLNGGSSWTDGSGSSLSLADGTYAAGQVKIQQWNSAEAPSAIASNSAAFTVDSAGPAGSIDSNFTIDSDIAISVSGLSSGAFLEYSADGGGSWHQAALEGDGKWHAHNAGVAAGGYLGVQLSDVAGNLGSAATAYVGDDNGGVFTSASGTIVFGNGGADTVRSANAGFLHFDGGSGTDTLQITGAAQTFDLSSLAAKLDDIEVIDLGAGNNELMVYSPVDVNAVAGSVLTIEGSAGTVDIGSHHWLLGVATAEYHVYLLGLTTLRVANALSIEGSTILL
jgi:hypothetical protein